MNLVCAVVKPFKFFLKCRDNTLFYYYKSERAFSLYFSIDSLKHIICWLWVAVQMFLPVYDYIFVPFTTLKTICNDKINV